MKKDIVMNYRCNSKLVYILAVTVYMPALCSGCSVICVFILAIIHRLQSQTQVKYRKKTLVNGEFNFSVGQVFTDAFTLAYIKK